MARALIVGCGCRGRALGRRLLDEGWQVRGTTRGTEGAKEIEAAGIEARVADPARPATVLEAAEDATVVTWLLGSMRGEPSEIADVHGPKLERFLAHSVETPMRRFLYEASGTVDPGVLVRGEEIVREAGARWSIPFGILGADPGNPSTWGQATLDAALGRAPSADGSI